MESIDETLDLTPIQQFYSNTKILITGATGFFGKVLLEKLLRSCPDISKIYIIVRQKRGKDSRTRAREMVDNILFQRLKSEQPNFVDKVVGIEGDCALPNLGLNSQDREVLTKEVNIIFHLAATVNLSEKLKTSILINIRGTRDVLSFAREMPNLKAFMHVSTAYCNCIHEVIEEKIYPPASDGNMLIMMAENLPDAIFDEISKMIVGKYPNTYTFTKQIAEAVVNNDGANLPVGIHRPAIAISTYKEPVRSWIDNVYGATGLVAYIGLDMIRTIHGNPYFKTNVIPVDMCMNSLIAAAWDVASLYEENRSEQNKFQIPVYHYESNSENPITWSYLIDRSFYYSTEISSFTARWAQYKLHTNFYVNYLHRLFLHLLPAFFLDLIFLCLGKSPILMKMYSKLHKLMDVLSHFGTREWIYKSNNIRRVLDKMTDRDRDIFFSDLRQLDWNDFFKTYMKGIELYIYKDERQIITRIQQKWKSIYWIHQFVSIAIGILLFLLLWNLMKIFLFSFN